MRMRTFLAPTMADAMAQLRQALGDEAVIVSSYETPDGMTEIVGAAETPPTAGFEALAPSAWQGLSDLEYQLETMLRERLRAGDAPSRNVNKPAPGSGIAFDLDAMARALDSHALPARLRDDLLSAAGALHHEDAVLALAAALEMRIGFEPIPAIPATPLMLIGTAGSGKTVTLAKLAARAIIDNGTCDILCADTRRTGALAQSEAYGALLGTRVEGIKTPERLTTILAARKSSPQGEAPVCLIDTASINPFDETDMSDLAALLAAGRQVEPLEPVLVAAATGDALLLSEIAQRFADRGVRRMIATQLDIARRLGPVLAAADAGELSLAQISVTPFLARGLAQLTPPICAELLLAPLTDNMTLRPSTRRKTGMAS